MSTRTRPNGRDRPPLTRARVVEVAAALADDGGVDGLTALTMRALATELGVAPMSLYHHVANKDEVLDALVEHVVLQIELPRPDAVRSGTDWRVELARRCDSARLALTRHPWCLHLIETRTTPLPTLLTHHEAVLATLVAAGFDVPTAGEVFAVLDAYTYGFALQQATLPFPTEPGEETAAQLAAVAGPMLEAMAGAYPTIAALAATAMTPTYDFAATFPVGLTLLLDGLDARRGA